MKYAKLVEIQKKAHKYDVIAGIATLVAVVLMLCCVFFLWKEMLGIAWLSAVAVLTVVDVTVILVFTRLRGRQERMAEDYFAIRIMDALTEQGIETSNFELVQETRYSYFVGFHNQTIDYEKLQAIIDEEVNAMNKRMNGITKVKLI